MLTKEQFDKAMFIIKVKTPKYLKWAIDLTYEKYLEMDRIINKREDGQGWGVCCLKDPTHAIHRSYEAIIFYDLDTGKNVNEEPTDGEGQADTCGVCEKFVLINQDELGEIEEVIEEE
jgi:hypothetical protein